MQRFNIIAVERPPLLPRLPLKKPLSIFIETTNLCNFRCVVCIHGSENTRNDLKPFQHMRMPIFKKIIHEIKGWAGPKLKLLRLAFHGEPFIQPEFCDMLKIAIDANIAERVDTFSNGSLMTEEIAENLVLYGLDHIRFSIYAATNSSHKEVTKSTITVEQIRDNIIKLRQIRDRYKSRKPYILVKKFDTYDQENTIFESMYKNIADEVGFEKVHNATKYKGNDLIATFYNDRAREAEIKQTFHEHLHSHVACPKPFMSMVINNIGDCLMCTLDAPKLTKIGSVTEKTMQELWQSDEAFQFRKMQLENRKYENVLCLNCDWFKLFPQEDTVDGFPIDRLREF